MSDLPKDIYTPTKRRSMTSKRRMGIFMAHEGSCCICGGKIDGTRDKWIIEHLTPLADGGEDCDDNCAPAHEACARPKTSKEASTRSRHRKAAERHYGAKERTSFATNRAGKYKRRLDGTVVCRATGKIIGKADK